MRVNHDVEDQVPATWGQSGSGGTSAASDPGGGVAVPGIPGAAVQHLRPSALPLLQRSGRAAWSVLHLVQARERAAGADGGLARAGQGSAAGHPKSPEGSGAADTLGARIRPEDPGNEQVQIIAVKDVTLERNTSGDLRNVGPGKKQSQI